MKINKWSGNHDFWKPPLFFKNALSLRAWSPVNDLHPLERYIALTLPTKICSTGVDCGMTRVTLLYLYDLEGWASPEFPSKKAIGFWWAVYLHEVAKSKLKMKNSFFQLWKIFIFCAKIKFLALQNGKLLGRNLSFALKLSFSIAKWKLKSDSNTNAQ